MKTIIAIFMVLHGVVYLIYLGHSLRYFELKPGMKWPVESWIFPVFASDKTIKIISGIGCFLSFIGFALTGILILTNKLIWLSIAFVTAMFSSVFFMLLWNGKKKNFDGQGGIGVVINLLIIAAILLFQYINFGS